MTEIRIRMQTEIIDRVSIPMVSAHYRSMAHHGISTLASSNSNINENNARKTSDI